MLQTDVLDADRRQNDLTAIWRPVGAILAQTALLTALLLFFGWARTRATYAYFGVDLSLLNLSTTDYVLRSVNSAYGPLLRIGLLVLAVIAVHQYVSRAGARAIRIRRGIAALGLALFAVGGSALLVPVWSDRIGHWVPDEPGVAFAWLPTTLTVAFALLAYVAATSALFGRSRWLLPALLALVVMALFWTVSLLAVHDGLAQAKAIERELPASTEVVVLSRETLVINGPGVAVSDLRLPDRHHPYGRYRKSYSGLRLLTHADGKYFLLPSHWRHGRDRVFEVPDDGDVRIELIGH